MRRSLRTLIVAAVAGIVLAGCAPAAPTATESPTTPSQTQAAPQTTAPADAASEPVSADQLCAEESVSDERDVCVLEGVTVTGDLSFESFRVVKLVRASVDGSVSVDAATREVVVTDSKITGDLDATAGENAVVKLSTIGGTLSVTGARSATLVKNTVGADLLCADGVQANGDGNTVAGTVTGTCSRVV